MLRDGKGELTCYWYARVGHQHPMVYFPRAWLVVEMVGGEVESYKQLGLTVMLVGQRQLERDVGMTARLVRSKARYLATKYYFEGYPEYT